MAINKSEEHKYADELVKQIAELRDRETQVTVEYEELKMKNNEFTANVQFEIQNEWENHSVKKKWIGTQTLQQEIAKRLDLMPEVDKIREDIKAITKEQIKIKMEIEQAKEILTNARIFGGNK